MRWFEKERAVAHPGNAFLLLAGSEVSVEQGAMSRYERRRTREAPVQRHCLAAALGRTANEVDDAAARLDISFARLAARHTTSRVGVHAEGALRMRVFRNEAGAAVASRCAVVP